MYRHCNKVVLEWPLIDSMIFLIFSTWVLFWSSYFIHESKCQIYTLFAHQIQDEKVKNTLEIMGNCFGRTSRVQFIDLKVITQHRFLSAGSFIPLIFDVIAETTSAKLILYGFVMRKSAHIQLGKTSINSKDKFINMAHSCHTIST